jgi:3-methyladenine DNA glycosylase AlkD
MAPSRPNSEIQAFRLRAQDVRRELRSLGSPESAAFAARYFKTGPGQYGAADIFLGIRAPAIRRVVRAYRSLSHAQVLILLRSRVHEDRLVALLILVEQYARAGSTRRHEIYETYLANTQHINNWDLVDASARHIVGAHLLGGDRSMLDRLARSSSLWERRISIIATFAFLRAGEIDDTLRIAHLLLDDREDLIHKAVGWSLRELGKRDVRALERFLEEYIEHMPRTTLRYAIERFPEKKRLAYLGRGKSKTRGRS